MNYEHYILQGEAKSTEFSDDRSYLLVQKANSYCACVGQTEECCLPKIVLTYDLGPLLYTCLDRCVWDLVTKYKRKLQQKWRRESSEEEQIDLRVWGLERGRGRGGHVETKAGQEKGLVDIKGL